MDTNLSLTLKLEFWRSNRQMADWENSCSATCSLGLSLSMNTGLGKGSCDLVISTSWTLLHVCCVSWTCAVQPCKCRVLWEELQRYICSNYLQPGSGPFSESKFQGVGLLQKSANTWSMFLWPCLLHPDEMVKQLVSPVLAKFSSVP